MRVAFRVDASIEIGTGHVMRCLTLADALRATGAECRFVTRDLPGHLCDRIASAGFAVADLPAPDGPAPDAPPAHAAWARVPWALDAAQTRASLAGFAADWMVLDHYAFDARWIDAISRPGGRCLVIDDLADRPLSCDMLVDQNHGHSAHAYAPLVPPGARCLVGADYALLRAEFAKARPASLARRGSGSLQRILVSMGGVDRVDATSRVLRALQASSLPDGVAVEVIMGRHAPALDQVADLARTLRFRVELAVDVDNMAERMTQADLAISAGGSTSWERCCLGLPSIIVETADNQGGIGAALAEAGAGFDAGRFGAEDLDDRLTSALDRAQNPSVLHRMSHQAQALCDGLGAGRVAHIMEAQGRQ